MTEYLAGPGENKMKIYLVTEPQCHDQTDTMNEIGAENRLMSYYYLRNARASFLEDYKMHGHGRFIDEEADKIRKMSTREFFEFLNENNKKEDLP
jgi:hypothetical protein